MTTILAATTSFTSTAFGTLVRSFRVMRVRRAQRLAVRTLLEMDRGRLDDLGIDLQDVHDAFAAPAVGQHFERRRQARALGCAPPAALVEQH